MGPRLGRRMVLKISNWFRVSKKSRYYALLQSENCEEQYPVRLGQILGVRSVNSHENSPYFNSSGISSPASLTVSPNLTVNSTSEDHSHLSQSSIKGILHYLSQGVHYSKHLHVPKGFLAVCVGQGEESQRFCIPVLYFNHPLFVQLLKKVEEEYGFDHHGIIKIRCDVAEFQNVQKLIDAKHKGQSM